jgi:hypothetical protein
MPSQMMSGSLRNTSEPPEEAGDSDVRGLRVGVGDGAVYIPPFVEEAEPAPRKMVLPVTSEVAYAYFVGGDADEVTCRSC